MKPIYLINLAKAYLKAKRELRRFDSMSLQEVRDLQFNRLKELVEKAWETVPFYRSLWTEKGFNPSDLRTLDDMALIPMIDRNDVIAHCEEFIPANQNRASLSLISTGGTSGMPMQFYIDNYLARGKEVGYVGHINRKYFGCRMFDREAIMRGDRIVSDAMLSKHCFWKYSLVKRGLAMSSFHLTQQNLQYYLDKLRSYAPQTIRAYPSTIVALCHLMKENGEKPLKSLKRVICSSENVTESQRRLVREVLGVEIESFYGHTEKCVVAFQGASGQMLFHPLYGYTEFINKSGESTGKAGELAEVVVTGLAHDYFPLIRYRTNDLIEIGQPEGLFEKTASRIMGREQDFVYDCQGNRIIFTNSDEPFWDVTGILAYQYIQDAPGQLTVRLQVNDTYEKSSERSLLKEIDEVFPGFEVEFDYVDEIAKTPRGKFKYLIQNIKR